MIIFYNTTTKNVHHTEDYSMIPVLPHVESTGEQAIKDKRAILAQQNLDFVSVPQQLGAAEVLTMKVCFDTNGNFIGLQPQDTQN